MRIDGIGGDRDGNARAFRRRPSIVVGLWLAVVFVGLGGSASAAITGLERVPETSPINSANNKSVTASCMAGKRVIGAGGELLGSGGLVVGFVRPDATLSSVTVQGREDENGTTSHWTATAYAICATPPPGLERVAAASPSNPANKRVTATCPTGTRLLGAGAEIEGGGGQVAPNDIIPGSSLKGVTVQGLEDENGTTANWRARAYAICASPVAGLERVSATSSNDSSGKQVSASCPAGKQVTGAGAELGGGGGEVVLGEFEIDPGMNDVVVRGLEDENGTASNWFVRAYAICAAVSERVSETGPINSASKSATAACPPDTRAVGGGGDITGGGGQVMLNFLDPSATGLNFLTRGLEDEDGTASDWTIRAYAICATPLPGLQVVTNSSATNSSDKSISVTCPAGTRVVGAGGRVSAGMGQVVLNTVFANSALTSTAALGLEDENGFGGNWSVTAHAVCANPPPGLELVQAVSDLGSDPASVTATCPSDKNLLGTGAAISSGFGEVVLDDVRPNAALTRTTVTALEDENGLATDWDLIAQSICASP